MADAHPDAGATKEEEHAGAEEEEQPPHPGPVWRPSSSRASTQSVPLSSASKATTSKAAAAVVVEKRAGGIVLIKPGHGYAIAPVYDKASGMLMGARVAADGENTGPDHVDDDASVPTSSTPATSIVGDDDTELGERSITFNDFICPITKEFPEHPVMLRGDGRFYEHSAITAWLADHNRSPITNRELTPADRELVETSGIAALFESLKKLAVNAKKLTAAARSYKFAAKLKRRKGSSRKDRSRSRRRVPVHYTRKEFKEDWRAVAKENYDEEYCAFKRWRRTLFPRDVGNGSNDQLFAQLLFINLGSDAERWAFHEALPRVLDENTRVRASLGQMVFWWGGSDNQRVLAAACVQTLINAGQVPALRKVRFWDVGHHVRRNIFAELREARKRGLSIRFASKLTDAEGPEEE